MRIFVGGIATETNTFAPWSTGLRSFEEGGLFRGDSRTKAPGSEVDLLVGLWRDCAAGDGHQLEEGLLAQAQPSGPVLRLVYEGLRDELLDQLRSRGPFDIVLLALHGAMVAHGYDDCEGDIIARVRDIVGRRTSIGVELDPHCHLTPLMTAKADVIIFMKEYPHTDYLERARELYDLCRGQAEGRLRPVIATFDCRMIGFYPTTSGPMAGLVERLREVERRPSILSASIVHGFPWGDVPDTGTKVMVVAEGDLELAAVTAREIGLELYAARDQLLPRFLGVEPGLDEAERSPGCVVVADTADNAGGGAPSDNVELLRALLRRRVRDAAFGCIWDPMAAQICAEAGSGAQFRLRLGGKSGPASGDPLDLDVTVRAVAPDHSQAALGPARVPMGLAVWLEIGGIDVVVNSIRTQTFAPDAFTGLGIDLGSKRLVAVKSSWHFQARFAPIASRIIPLATSGAIQMNFAEIPYRNRRDLNFFPRVADPLGAPALPGRPRPRHR
jgi:microcystin degradation protein MlrC